MGIFRNFSYVSEHLKVGAQPVRQAWRCCTSFGPIRQRNLNGDDRLRPLAVGRLMAALGRITVKETEGKIDDNQQKNMQNELS